MILDLFNRKPLLDNESTQWMFDVFDWALHNFGADVFHQQTILVTPTPDHFPGREDTIDAMARLIFRQVLNHAGLLHWPFQLIEESEFTETEAPGIMIQGALRGAGGLALKNSEISHALKVTYDARLVSNPAALIANYAHVLAQYLGSTAQTPPPGGEENWPHVTELLAIFMGFGLMFSNSANNFKTTSCGSCQTPRVERSAYLSQYDTTYALAMFSVLKNYPDREVLPHLKKSLRTFYRKSASEIKSRNDDLNSLRKINSPVRFISDTLPLR